MTPRAAKLIRRMHRLTSRQCRRTGCEFDCCTIDFCGVVRAGLQLMGEEVEPVTREPWSYKGPSGCVVPPELRPGCSGFLCPAAWSSDLARRCHDLYMAAMEDEDVGALTALQGDHALQAIGRMLEEEGDR